MVSDQVTIVNRLGLHARAAAKFIKIAKSYRCAVRVGRADDQQLVDGKSIMRLMTLVAETGTVLILETEGLQEKDAHEALTELIDNKFWESE